LQTPSGLRTTYLMSLGSNYPRGTGWRHAGRPGTHRAPFGIATDSTGSYIAAQTTENIETCLLKLSPDGNTRLWSAETPTAWDGATSLAVEGNDLYMLGKVNPLKVYVYNAATGALTRSFSVQWKDGVWDQALDSQVDMDLCTGVLVVAYTARDTIRLKCWAGITATKPPGALMSTSTAFSSTA
jgi:hypothetical protein